MVPSLTLFKIIHSLTRSEKRHFQLWAKGMGGGGTEDLLYMKMFRIIEKMKKYDEELLKKKMNSPSAVKMLPRLKKYLIQNILRSLRSHGQDSTVEGKVGEMLVDIRFLYNKELYTDCDKLLKKALEKVQKFEMVAYEIQLLDLRLKIFTKHPKLAGKGMIQQNQALEQRAIARLKRERELVELSTNIGMFLKSRGTLSKKEQENHQLNLEERLYSLTLEGDETFNSKSNYFYSASTIASLKGELESVYENQKELHSLWESNVHQKEEFPARFRAVAYNYLNSCFLTHKFAEFEESVARLKEIKVKHLKDGVEAFQMFNYIEFLYFLNTAQFPQAVEAVAGIEKGLREFGDLIMESRRLAFSVNIASLFFVTENFSRALNYVFLVTNLSKDHERTELRYFARTLALILNYEMDNRDVLMSMIRTFKRGSNQEKQQYVFEAAIVKAIKNLIEVALESERREIFRQLNKDLLQINESLGDVSINGSMEITFWAQSRAEQVSLQKLVTDNVRGEGK